MKRIVKVVSVILVGFLVLTGCQKINKEEALNFKKEYEALNGQTNSKGNLYRSVTISESNPFVKTTIDKVAEKINNGETFYVYFGDARCPWCRIAIESAIEVANESKISEILYVPLWDSEGNETFRDKFILNDQGFLEKVSEGSKSYDSVLEKLDSLLEYYTINNEGVISNIGEKRIYGSTYIYVKNGEGMRMTKGTPEYVSDANEELTKEIKDEQKKLFNDFFKGTTCTDTSGC